MDKVTNLWVPLKTGDIFTNYSTIRFSNNYFITCIVWFPSRCVHLPNLLFTQLTVTVANCCNWSTMQHVSALRPSPGLHTSMV